MPNHVQTSVTINGPLSLLYAIRERFFEYVDEEDFIPSLNAYGPTGKKVWLLTFEKIIPKPEGFEPNLPSGSGDEAYDLYFDPNSSRVQTMLHYAHVNTAVQLRELLEKEYIPTEKHPTYRSLAEAYKRNIELTGTKCWYDWNTSNWGTKWDAYSQNVSEIIDNGNGNGTFVFYFETAWGFPEPVWDKLLELIKEFPDADKLSFSGTTDEEGGFFYGDFGKDGIMHFKDGVREGGPYDWNDED